MQYLQTSIFFAERIFTFGAARVKFRTATTMSSHISGPFEYNKIHFLRWNIFLWRIFIGFQTPVLITYKCSAGEILQSSI